MPPLTLKDLSGATKSLANAGAGIVELNTVRKHIDILKGGGLAQLAYPAQVKYIITFTGSCLIFVISNCTIIILTFG